MLDDLVTAIQTVQERIREHGNSLSQNEYRTRIALIDPILNALGWDVADPTLVTIEDHHSGGGTPDYALLGDDRTKPLAFVEAKRLGEPLNAHQNQVFRYTWDRRVLYAGLTDGDRWVLEDVTAEFDRPPRNGRLLDLTISRETAYQCALKMLLIWRPTFTAGQPVEASEPVLATLPRPESAPKTSEPVITTVEPPISPTPPPTGWISVDVYEPSKHDQLPKVRLPDKKETQLRHWYELLVEVSEWLVRIGQLSADTCPVPGAVKGKSMINSVPLHDNGTEIYYPHKLSNGLFLNRQGNSFTLQSNVMMLLRYYRQDPTTILLKFG